MANVVINGVTYSDVPQVDIPKAGGGGDATFYSPGKRFTQRTALLPVQCLTTGV